MTVIRIRPRPLPRRFQSIIHQSCFNSSLQTYTLLLVSLNKGNITVLLLLLSSLSLTTFTHSVYNYTSKQTTFLVYIYSVAAVLYLQSVLHVMLFPLFSMFCTFTSALPAVCSAQYGSFLQLLTFALSRYVALSHFQTVPVALLLPVSLLYLQSTCAQFLPYSLHILGFSQLLSSSHSCPLFIITHYAVQFTVTDSSVTFHCSFRNMATVPS